MGIQESQIIARIEAEEEERRREEELLLMAWLEQQEADLEEQEYADDFVNDEALLRGAI